MVESFAGINKRVKPCRQHHQQRRGLDPAAWVTSSSGASSISEGSFCAPPPSFLGLWPAELGWWAGSRPYGWCSWMCFLQLRGDFVQMHLEAAQHLSGLPRYAISLLVMLQMRLLFVAILDVQRAHTQRFPEITTQPHVTQATPSPATTLVALKKVRVFFSPFFWLICPEMGKPGSENKKDDKNKIEWDCNFIHALQSTSGIQHLLVSFSWFLGFQISLAETAMSGRKCTKAYT